MDQSVTFCYRFGRWRGLNRLRTLRLGGAPRLEGAIPSIGSDTSPGFVSGPGSPKTTSRVRRRIDAPASPTCLGAVRRPIESAYLSRRRRPKESPDEVLPRPEATM